MRKSPIVSIIIPVLNEAGCIGKTLAGLPQSEQIEIIVADGGSTDGTVDIVQVAGVKIIHAPRGRACQMNAGASASSGDIHLFLHADTELPPGFETPVHDALSRPDTAAGAFRLAINGDGFGLRFIEKLANWRAMVLKMPYGDQAIFMTAAMFKGVGGFSELPIMEDVALIRALRQKGRIVILSLPVRTSARRWQKNGVVRTTLINQLILLGFLFGIPSRFLANLYRQR